MTANVNELEQLYKKRWRNTPALRCERLIKSNRKQLLRVIAANDTLLDELGELVQWMSAVRSASSVSPFLLKIVYFLSSLTFRIRKNKTQLFCSQVFKLLLKGCFFPELMLISKHAVAEIFLSVWQRNIFWLLSARKLSPPLKTSVSLCGGNWSAYSHLCLFTTSRKKKSGFSQN